MSSGYTSISYLNIGIPFTKRYYNDFGISVMIQNGFEVHALDFSPLIEPKIFKNTKLDSDFPNHILVKSWDEVKSIFRMMNKEKTLLIMVTGLNLNILKIISEYDLDYTMVSPRSLPKWSREFRLRMLFYRNPVDTLRDFKSKFKSRNKKTLGSLLQNYQVTKRAKYHLSVNAARTRQYLINDETIDVEVPSTDFNIALDDQSKRLIENEYAVFLDQYEPYHPETYNLPPIDVERYFSEINRFFNFFEKQTKLKIIIAAHPLSNYQQNPFEDREMIKYTSNNLVRHSRYCLTHYSTAINFAIIHNKPIVLISTGNDLKRKDWRSFLWTQLIGEHLGIKSINISRPLTYGRLSNSLQINKEKYQIYFEKYIRKKNTPSENSWQIFANVLKTPN